MKKDLRKSSSASQNQSMCVVSSQLVMHQCPAVGLMDFKDLDECIEIDVDQYNTETVAAMDTNLHENVQLGVIKPKNGHLLIYIKRNPSMTVAFQMSLLHYTALKSFGPAVKIVVRQYRKEAV